VTRVVNRACNVLESMFWQIQMFDVCEMTKKLKLKRE